MGGPISTGWSWRRRGGVDLVARSLRSEGRERLDGLALNFGSCGPAIAARDAVLREPESRSCTRSPSSMNSRYTFTQQGAGININITIKDEESQQPYKAET